MFFRVPSKISRPRTLLARLEPSGRRDLRLDFFRGIALMFIFVDHIPENVLSYFTPQTLCFFDAAEIFIFISGLTAMLVYSRQLSERGAIFTFFRVLRRAWQLYVAHIFMFVLFVAEVSYIAAQFDNPMFVEEMRVADFVKEPHIAIIEALSLQFQPTFLDILPLYIVMLLIFPLVLVCVRRDWLITLLVSSLLYLIVQVFGFSLPAYPPGRVWFFNPFAWQFLFITGAVLAHLAPRVQKLPSVAFHLMVTLFLASVIVRVSWTMHEMWQPIPPLLVEELSRLKSFWPAADDKTNLSPLRLIAFFGLVVLVATRVPSTARFLASSMARPLVVCGQHSLEIFCLSILLSALGHFVLVEYSASIPVQLLVNALGIATMMISGQIMLWYKSVDKYSDLC